MRSLIIKPINKFFKLILILYFKENNPNAKYKAKENKKHNEKQTNEKNRNYLIHYLKRYEKRCANNHYKNVLQVASKEENSPNETDQINF